MSSRGGFLIEVKLYSGTSGRRLISIETESPD